LPTPYSSDDLGRVFESRTLTRGRSLVLIGAVQVSIDGDIIKGIVDDKGVKRTATVEPAAMGARTVFVNRCSCRLVNCPHLAATAFAALDRFPALRKVTQQVSFMEKLAAEPGPEKNQLKINLEPGMPPNACFVSLMLVGDRTQRLTPISPARLIEENTEGDDTIALANLLGGGTNARNGVPAESVASLIAILLRLEHARWGATNKRLIAGEERTFDANVPPRLPARSAIIFGDTSPWYVDAATGQVGRVHLRKARPAPPPPVNPRPRGRMRGGPTIIATDSERAIIERPITPVMRLQRLRCPDDFGRLTMMDALMLDFDYGGTLSDGDDERQFVRVDGPGGPTFMRRNIEAEASAFETIRADGFVQMRVSDGKSARGRRVFVFRGEDAGEQWHRFIAERVPALESLGFRSLIDKDFGPRMVQKVGEWDVRISDARTSTDGSGTIAPGNFELDFGIEIDGERIALLPILSNLLARGGMENAQIIGEDLITTLEDGRVVKLPAERIRRMLAIMGDLIEAAGAREETIVLPESEAPTVIELEQLLLTRFHDAHQIEAYTARFRGDPEIPGIVIPPEFKGELRHYQEDGVAWLQHLMASKLGAFLADDMGLGKTAQTIAHITVEHAAGRMTGPALIVVPTSLITNWTSELEKFAPSLKVMVLHGLDRHKKRETLENYDAVVTTYTVLTRDILEMKTFDWHIIVLDEAQAIKTPDAKATKAVCQLDARQRLCLSGTPIENNLEELWSQFAFLMPGLLGDRRGFTKRFRTPIEKNGDAIRRIQLARRIKPFIMRRKKSEVATELPPKHTILRRITLAPDQRELYETIRVTMYEKVREQVAEKSLAQSRIIVLDALLKLRQACCDPRLVKLRSAREIESSSKLDDLLEMMAEMLPEGRRILLFSQFTSMLDLIKPRLREAGIPFVELRGDTMDRAEPVRSFEAGEVALFLISLKAGGRGLNLTSADTVIHYDPWWNPAVEDQASDRAHRIGQTKSVFVYKMIAADTVEERILELQQRKAELAALAFSEDVEDRDTADLGTLDAGDIDFLFGSSEAREREAA
jgi:superfamily II DNA or RNA helicase